MELEEGAQVWLICHVADGMFPTEKYVQVEVNDEKDITGFIPAEDVILNGGDNGWVRTVLRKVLRDQDKALLLFRGELLSRTNPVAVSYGWVSDNSLDEPSLR